MSVGISIKLTGSLAFCGLLVYLGVWKDNEVLTFFGTILGTVVVAVNVMIAFSEHENR